MSYARFIESDVYVFMLNGTNKLACMACSFGDIDSVAFLANSTQEMLDHLELHKKAGDRLPEDIFDNLKADDPKNYPNTQTPT